jgi:uncharacterized protein with FMN-binding domain
MRKLKKLLRNAIHVALVVALTVPNVFYSIADAAEVNATITSNMLVTMGSTGGATYKDGTSTGKGIGRNGDIINTVTIADGKISNVDVEQQEAPTYWEKAKYLINTIIAMGNPSSSDIDELDAVSGATLSSNGIKEAMKAALANALSDETIFAGGKGTEHSPFLIANATQLQNFAKAVNAGEPYTSQYIKLSEDINISAIEWIPIGSDTHPFGGFFDGNKKSVTNLSIGKSDSYAAINKAGFFGKLNDGASVKNLTIDNAKIYAVGEAGSKVYGAGIMAASAKNNSIDKCNVINSEIYVKSDDQQFVYVAGLIGYLDQNSCITNSFSDCSISGKSGNSVYAGGISGLTGNKTLVMNNRLEGSVEAEVLSGGKTTATAVGGGISGMASGVTYNCYAGNTVRAANNTAAVKLYKGALVAWSTANGCVLNSCYNSATTDAEPVIIYPSGSTFFGGIFDIKEKNAQETADILHNNLYSSSIEASKNLMLEKAPSKDFGFEANLDDKVFYDWEVLNSKASLSENVWKEKFNPANIFASGTGTESDPYIVETEEQMREFAISLSDENNYEDKFIKLVKDLDVSNINWTPVGEGEYAFCGTFDGSRHVIKGILVKGKDGTSYNAGNEVYFGLFGVIGKSGIVKNVNIQDVNIDIYRTGSTVVGGICGLNDGGTINSCSVNGNLKGQTTEKGNNYVGGIAGWSIKGYIVNSYTNADVYSSVLPTALAMSGGIVGMSNRSVIANCYSLGKTTGHTKRELEAVESMASVGGLVGVAGSPVVNCYTIADTISEDYSYYVGATIGWATGIAQVYDIYYSTQSNQSIQNKKVSPISEIGWIVRQGINEHGEVYLGALTYKNKGLTAEIMKSQSLADELNANFDSFPLGTDYLPANIQLKKWTVQDGVVTFSDEYATRTYIKPDVETPTLTGNYNDGTFYGRAETGTENSYVNVTMEVQNRKITSIKSDTEIEGINAVIENVLQTNQAPDVSSSDSTSMTGFKKALRRATIKALKGDYTDYSSVNPSIFEGGDGSKDNPYKIATANQLVKFAAAINEVEHFKEKYIILTNNIDLSGIQWVPAGGSGLYAFSGNFDGKGYAISHMQIGSKSEPAKYSCAGLFAHTDTANISNLSVKDSYIHIEPVSIPGVDSERTYAGMLVGYAGMTDTTGTTGTTIDNCYVAGEIISDSVESNYVGGVAGMLVHSLLSNSYSNCEIEAICLSNWVYTGGLVGLPAFSILLNNVAYGKIHSDAAVNKTQLGGIAGMYSSYAFNNYSDVNLTTEKQTPDIGGIVGRITGIGYISNCYGNITAEQKNGNKEVTGANTVGTIVSGERYGKGRIEKSELVSAIDQTLVYLLNQNISFIGKDTMYTELVSGWFVYIPENIKYNTWTIKDGEIMFATKNSSNSQGTSNSSKESSVNSKTDNTTDYKVEPIVNKGSASAEEKADNNPKYTEEATHNMFTDIPENAWYKEAVQYISKNGIMNGVGGTTFAPNTNSTRAMVCTILWNMENKPTQTAQSKFKDVSNNSWYAQSVTWANQQGITKGVGESSFAPNANATRQQIAQFLYSYANYKGHNLEQVNDLSSYKDIPSGWAENAVKWAVGNKIMIGKGNGILDPQGTATRAEIAQMIMKFNKNIQLSRACLTGENRY